jgi:hypothetical protein
MTPEQFQNAREMWKMEFAYESFFAVRKGVQTMLERNLTSESPEYYPLLIGIFCLYGRPFTNNRPVGPLSKEIVPKEHLKLHNGVLSMRHQILAHSDASAFPYPNELRLKKEQGKMTMFITRILVSAELFESITPLVDALIEKTFYYKEKFTVKLKASFLHARNGEFRINILDPNGPVFIKISESADH